MKHPNGLLVVAKFALVQMNDSVWEKGEAIKQAASKN
jgi:hypothetical protein